MGLHTILKKLKLKEREMKLLLVGLDNAGKTTIVKKFNGEVCPPSLNVPRCRVWKIELCAV
eukprot:SAG11_NODE_438_length_9463_cov_47.214957_5_plen_61_part_00